MPKTAGTGNLAIKKNLKIMRKSEEIDNTSCTSGRNGNSVG